MSSQIRPTISDEVDRFAAELGAADAREREEVVDELAHALCAGAHPAEVVAPSLVEAVAVVLEQRLAEAVDRAQRRAQVVRDRVAERLELLVLPLELLDERRARLGELARGRAPPRPRSPSQELLADAPVLVLELLAADLRAHARLEDLELARLGDVVVGPGAEALDHRRAVLERGEHDERDVADQRAQP